MLFGITHSPAERSIMVYHELIEYLNSVGIDHMLLNTTGHAKKNGMLYDDQSRISEDQDDKDQKNNHTLKSETSLSQVIVIGGDGHLLHAIQNYRHLCKKFYGVNTGTLGFLLNEYESAANTMNGILHGVCLPQKLLSAEITTESGKRAVVMAFNEISLFRHTGQVAMIRVTIDNVVRLDPLIADGVLVSSPAGSSAYNLSAGGMIVPLNSNLLCLTPICPFKPRRWHGAILPATSVIEFEIMDIHKRPVDCSVDSVEFERVTHVKVSQSDDTICVGFDCIDTVQNHVLKAQFD